MPKKSVTRTLLCKECGEEFEWTKLLPVKGRWPAYHKECNVSRTKRSKREHMQKIRRGETTYRPVAPLWDETEHEGPGSRPSVRKLDYWEDFPESPKSNHYPKNERGNGKPKKAPVSSGDAYEDALRRALLLQDSDWLWRTSRGPDEGETVLGLPQVQLDEECKQWLLDNPYWWKE